MGYSKYYRFNVVWRGFILVLLLAGFSASLVGQSDGATMTVYKGGSALIKQPVEWEVESGITQVKFDVFPSGILEDSPFLNIDGARVGYQRLNRNVFTWEKYFTEKVGQEVELGTANGDEFEGILQFIDSKRIVIKQKSYIRMLARNRIDWITAVGEIPEQQYKPFLSWDLYAREDRTVDGSLTYLSNGFSWNAIYRLVLAPDEPTGELITEAIISNQGQLDFADLELQLVEGNLNRIYQRPGLAKHGRPGAERMQIQSFDAPPPTPAQAALGDYHIYSLPERIDLAGQENVTVRLYNPSQVNLIKTYLFKNSERSQREEPLSVEYKFANTEENQLNKPLPQGKVEIFQATDRGSIEFTGEDQIGQVPKGETVELIAGKSFDVIGKRKVINYDRQRKSEQAAIELAVTNTRDEEVSVKLIETITGDWVIRDESTMYIKEDANTIYFPLTIPAGESVRITYTYRKAWN